MNLLLVSDIFGRTEALDALATRLSPKALIVDPYHGQNMGFDTEAAAYACFQKQLGVDRYAALLREQLSLAEAPCYAIGFSVGAAALWLRVIDPSPPNIAGVTAYYGSQIRHMPPTQPSVPVELVFPASEAHFSISALMSSLSGFHDLSLRQTTGGHGFMNRLSENFDEMLYESEVSRLREIVTA